MSFGFAVAQNDPSLDTGLKPYGSYHGGDLDSVSLTNGNLTLHIPLAGYPQRGNLGYTPRIIYNSKGRLVCRAKLQFYDWSVRSILELRGKPE